MMVRLIFGASSLHGIVHFSRRDDTMRIVVHGQQAFGKSVLEALLERGERVVGVYCAPDPAQGGRVDPLKEAALAKGLPVHQPKSFRNKQEGGEELRRHKQAS